MAVLDRFHCSIKYWTEATTDVWQEAPSGGRGMHTTTISHIIAHCYHLEALLFKRNKQMKSRTSETCGLQSAANKHSYFGLTYTQPDVSKQFLAHLAQ